MRLNYLILVKVLRLIRRVFYEINDIVSEGIHKGQHLHHIIVTHELSISRSTLYRYVKKGYMDVAPIDFPRIVKFKPRKSHDLPPIPSKDKVGHHYSDFLEILHSGDYHYWLEWIPLLVVLEVGLINLQCILL